ncbi:MAG: HAD-IB family phosphatase [Erysipelotrichaceae bacterium]|nr:HAD-IB family phosphatase [Erysipelotrichaceae bacterium]
MNVYDFDGTIFEGDSTVKFMCYLYKKRLSLKYLFKSAAYGLGYLLKIVNLEKMKEAFFSYWSEFDNIEELVEDYWDQNEKGIKDFYKKQMKDDDLIISASPDLIIGPICKRLNVAYMASPNDHKTGKFHGHNCVGEEKVRRFHEAYPDGIIEEFYSDSFNDTPLAKIAKKAYMVKGLKIEEWKFK